MGVRFEGRVGERRGELAGHAEVDDEGGGVVEVGEDFFAAAGDGGDGAAFERLREVGAARFEDILASEGDLGDGEADEGGAEGADDGFDFGEFGHDGAEG